MQRPEYWQMIDYNEMYVIRNQDALRKSYNQIIDKLQKERASIGKRTNPYSHEEEGITKDFKELKRQFGAVKSIFDTCTRNT